MDDEYAGGSAEELLGFFGGNLVDGLAYDFISDTVWVWIIISYLQENVLKKTNVERKSFVFFKFDKKDRVPVMYRHQFTLSISFF